MLHPATNLGFMIFTAAFVTLGTSGLCPAQEPVNLLRNAGAEDVKRDQPSFWFAAQLPAEGLRMWRATDVVHSGQAALAISNEHEYDRTVCNNWAQDVAGFHVGAMMELSAYVKTENADVVNLCIQCWDETKTKMLAFGSTPVLRGSQEWALVRSQPVFVPSGTASIIVRASLTGKGAVWFDDLALSPIEAEATVPTSDSDNLLGNPGAEQAVGDAPLVWFAAAVPADGLRMWRATDEQHRGEASLAISNEHEYEERVHNNWAQKVWNVSPGTSVALSAYVKTENAESANLCIQCWDQARKQMLAFGSTDVLSGTQDWTPLRTRPVTVPHGTASITIRAVLTGTGKVWFDDLALEVIDLENDGPVNTR
jgi:hypothetical protein